MPNVPGRPERPEPGPILMPEPTSQAKLIELEIKLLQAEVELARLMLAPENWPNAKPQPVNVPTAWVEALRGL